MADCQKRAGRALDAGAASRLDHALGAELGDVPVERIAVAGEPSNRITEFAHHQDIDLIMMPTHGLGLFRSLLVGSTTSKVLHDAQCPVWTAAHAEQQRNGGVPRRILCAVEGGSEGFALLKWADNFSERIGATLTVLHVVGPMPDWPSFEPDGALQEQMRQAAHEKMLSLQASAGVRVPLHVAVGEIAPTVAAEARQQAADLILIGRGSLQGPLGRLRTHAYGIIQQSPSAVLSI